MARTDAQVLMDQGRRQGKREGRREMLLEQLAFKFGALSDETRAAVEGLSEQRLKEFAQRLLTARSLEELGL